MTVGSARIVRNTTLNNVTLDLALSADCQLGGRTSNPKIFYKYCNEGLLNAQRNTRFVRAYRVTICRCHGYVYGNSNIIIAMTTAWAPGSPILSAVNMAKICIRHLADSTFELRRLLVTAACATEINRHTIQESAWNCGSLILPNRQRNETNNN